VEPGRKWLSDQPGLEHLRSVADDPQSPGEGELLIRVAAAALNFSDLLMIDDLYQVRPKRPFTPGQELAGVVVEAGAGCRFGVGDRIASKVLWGGFANHAIVNDLMAIAVPESVSLQEAAAVPVSLTTAVVALTESTELQPEETILVHAGAGALGQSTIRVARALGARVIATAGSPDKCHAATAAGAEHCIDYRDSDFVEEVKVLTDNRGVDVVLDPVGGHVGVESLRCLAWRGRLLIAGFSGGTLQQLPAHRLLLNGASAVGVYWNHDTDLAMVRRAEEKMLKWWIDGQVTPHVDHRPSLDAIPAALADFAARRTIGKVVATIAAVSP
jgi:NADPH2:quinone reductase